MDAWRSRSHPHRILNLTQEISKALWVYIPGGSQGGVHSKYRQSQKRKQYEGKMMAITKIIGKAVRDHFRGGNFRQPINQNEITCTKMAKLLNENSLCDFFFFKRRKGSVKTFPKIKLVSNKKKKYSDSQYTYFWEGMCNPENKGNFIFKNLKNSFFYKE